MLKVADALGTRTTTDIVFDQLHEEISTLRLLPGARISEADIANKLGVSRQPETIESCKQSVNRLCVLSMRNPFEGSAVVDDHQGIANALAAGSVKKAREAVEHHLSRLDATIAEIHTAHANYFE